MRFQTRSTHTIDFLFPIALFFVFAASALTVILLAAGTYRSVTENASGHFEAVSSLAYISEKIYQNDAKGSISLGTFDGEDALIIRHSYEDTDYYTYIYVHDGNLMELFVKDGVQASAQSGRIIMSDESLTMEQLKDDLFSFTCTDEKGHKASTVVSIRSFDGTL